MSDFLSIKDAALRNKLRGAKNNSDRVKKLKTIEASRKLVSLGDANAFAKLLLDTNLDDLAYGSGFPANQKEFLNISGFIKPMNQKIEVLVQALRIEKHYSKLDNALQSLREITDCILGNQVNEAAKLIDYHIENFGFSRSIVDRVVYLYSNHKIIRASEDSDIGEHLKTLMDSIYKSDSFGLATFYKNNLLDALDPGIPVFDNIRYNYRTYQRLIDVSKDKIYVEAVALRTFYPCLVTSLSNAKRFLLFSTSSLIDTAIDMGSIFGYSPKHADLVPEEIGKKISELVGRINYDEEHIHRHIDSFQSGYRDEAAYRLAGVLPECPTLFGLRHASDTQVLARQEWLDIMEPQFWRYFRRDLKLKHLSTPSNKPITQVRTFDNARSGELLRSFAVLHRLNQGDRFRDLAPNEIRVLLSQTTGFAQTLDIQEVLEIRDHGLETDNHVISFLALVMLNERAPDDDREFELRMSFQQVLNASYDGDIFKFLDWLNKRTPSLCAVVVDLCDVTFLEKLYLIYDEYVEVLEARRKVCLWAAKTLGNSKYAEAAERLAVDSKIRAIRGERDDTRIFVDELRFKQWLDDSIVDELRRFQRNIQISGFTDDHQALQPERDDQGRLVLNLPSGPALHWYNAISKAYEAFCLDKMFGIDSYLSRRIRHGTLSGFLQAPIKREIDSYLKQDSITEIEKRAVSEFAQSFSEVVAQLKDEHLHFECSQKPEGWFHSSPIANTTKLKFYRDIQTQMFKLFESGLSVGQVLPLIEEFCWRLLSPDLGTIRRKITEVLVLQIRPSLRRLERHSDEAKTAPFAAKLDQTITDLFSQLGNWFSRPERSAMTVTISELVQVVSAEMRDYNPDKEIKVHLLGEAGGRVSGATYQSTYDILFVLFGNAVRHGAAEKGIRVYAGFESGSDNYEVLRIKFSSFLKDGARSSQVKESIEQSLTEARKTSPMVREGKSGLGKARELIEAYPFGSDFSYHVTSEECAVSFALPVILLES